MNVRASRRLKTNWRVVPAALLSLALLILAGLTPALPALAAGMSGVFTVSDIAVEADGKTATRAREAARAAGQQEALTELLHRLTAPSDWPRVPQPDAASITDLVLSFQVQKEHLRPTHYTGTYTFHFDAADIRNLLNGAHIPFSELASKPVVLVPLLQNASGAHLWDDPNPWRDAWNNANGRAGLVPWIVPLGDIDDVEIFDTAQAQHPGANDISGLSRKYDDGDPVVVQAVETDTPDSATLAITVTRYSGEGVLTGTTSVSAPKASAALYTAGVVACRQLMEAHWKQIVATAQAGPTQAPPVVTDEQAGPAPLPGVPVAPGATGQAAPAQTGSTPVGSSTLAPLPAGPASPSTGAVPSGGPTTIEVAVPIADLGQWSRINDKLSHVDGIVEQDIVMMTNDEVLLSLKLSADPTSLGLAFAQQDLVLVPENGAYTLRLDANAAARLVPSELSAPPTQQGQPAAAMPPSPAPAPVAAPPTPTASPTSPPASDNGPPPSPSGLFIPPPGATSPQ